MSGHRPFKDLERKTADAIGGELVEPVTVNIPEARAVTVAPDEVLVVVMPSWLSDQQRASHRAHLDDVLGKRYMLIYGEDVQLAKVKEEDWARDALDTHER